MTYEEMQKTMQFIVEQQAQFAVDIQQLKESQARTEERVSQLTVNVSQMTEVVNRLAGATLAGLKDTNAKIDALVDAQIRNEENIEKTNEAVRNLTAVVDRHFRERNGQKDAN
jgi:chromosome segregation ATPase